MADKEIGDLTDGGAVQAGDLVHAVRGPNSRKVALGTAAGKAATEFATSAQGGKADSAVQPGDLAAVATSGDYGDLDNLPTLGDAAGKNIGTTAGTVAAGDDSRITGAAQKASNLSDLASASTARTNLGLGTAATVNVTISTSDATGGSDGDLWFKVS